jgi:hypothetical protein
METETALKPIENIIETIRSRIYEIRGRKVMLDRDLADLYHVETKRLNEAVKRNKERFPPDFMFQLSKDEFQDWRSQFVTSNDWMSQIATSNSLMSQTAVSNTIKMGMRKQPFVFTELGVSMLSSVLKSKEAIQMNINIMRAFVMMRQALSELSATNLRVEQLTRRVDDLSHYVDDILRDQNDINEATALQIDLIQDSLAELHAEKTERDEKDSRRRIGFRIETDP